MNPGWKHDFSPGFAFSYVSFRHGCVKYPVSLFISCKNYYFWHELATLRSVMTKQFKRYLVTSALPYANGPVHIGHLAGVYIPSDIYTRYLRLRGYDVISVCGSDEHGVPITMKARKEGITPQEVVDRYHAIIKKSFEGLGMSFDIYSRTSSATHAATASAFFRKLYDEGKFIEKTSMQYYDQEAQTFLADRYIIGTCPRCGNEKAYGDQCEQCGSTLSPDELIEPHSAVSGSVPIKKETTHWYLPLDQYEPFLREWILEGHKEWKANVYGQCKSWLDLGLQPRAVSRDLDWGIPVPVEGAEGKVLYVWFDAPVGYISATKDLTPEWEKYWKDPQTKMVHFIGKDNIVFHCIVFPAMLKAHGDYILPENVPANEFLNLEGEKISTSRNWAVWLHEYLEEFPGKEDVLRYVLCANAPEAKDNDFTWRDFQARNNNELVAVLGNFVNRALVLTQKYFDGVVPISGEYTDYERNAIAELAQVKNSLEGNIENYRFREALKDAMNIARIGNKYLADTEPWKVIKTDPERVKTILNLALQITANLTIAIEPFLPFSAAKMLKMLSAEKWNWEKLGGIDLLPTGHTIGTPTLLFEKIEDDVIQQQMDKLAATKVANLAAESVQSIEPQKDNISFDDFGRMDIRVSTILAAEKVAKTKKLLKLTVDTGIDTREIVSGIAEYFTPEALVGRQVLVLVNLEPRELKGILSRGMILMGEDASGKLVLLQPETKTNSGAIVG
ncbi:MAG: methionine--tRNA ligase [Alistipes sp.]